MFLFASTDSLRVISEFIYFYKYIFYVSAVAKAFKMTENKFDIFLTRSVGFVNDISEMIFPCSFHAT